MSKAVVVVRKWGNSIGITLPIGVVKREKIKANDAVVITVEKAAPLESLFGTLKTRHSTKEIMGEIRKGWD
ncbi:MAG: AbrB/MazE/SpoVT family DNA-binding domain-containing protein [Candidatus Diapherotrites archaeon]